MFKINYDVMKADAELIQVASRQIPWLVVACVDYYHM